MFSQLRSLARGVFHRSTLERDMADELRAHIDARAQDLVRQGLSTADAGRRARIDFGSLETCKDEMRRARGLRLLDDLRADIRYAVRTLVRTPAFATMAIVSLALG